MWNAGCGLSSVVSGTRRARIGYGSRNVRGEAICRISTHIVPFGRVAFGKLIAICLLP